MKYWLFNDWILIVVGYNPNKTGEYNPLYVPGSKLPMLGMVISPLIGIVLMGPYKPLRTWVDEFIPYYMEISWGFRPYIYIACGPLPVTVTTRTMKHFQ